MSLSLLVLLLQLLPLITAQPPRNANYTVGGAAGWFFDQRSNSTAANYTAWANSQSFFLGDYLIFNTDGRSTVIQTFNSTTYALCNQRQDFGNLTSHFVPEDGETGAIAVELDVEGVNYYFSDAQGGFQCDHGMRFRIVARALPEDAAAPPRIPAGHAAPPPPMEASSNGHLQVLGLPLFACFGTLLVAHLF